MNYIKEISIEAIGLEPHSLFEGKTEAMRHFQTYIQTAMQVYAIGEIEAIIMYKKEFPDRIEIIKK